MTVHVRPGSPLSSPWPWCHRRWFGLRDTEARPDRLLPTEVRGALRAPNQPSLRPTPSAMVIALAGCAVRRRTSAHAAAARGRARVSRNTVYLIRPPPLVGLLLPRDRRCSHPTCCRAAAPLASLGAQRTGPTCQPSRPTARSTRSALRVIISLGPERPQSTTSTFQAFSPRLPSRPAPSSFHQ